LTRFLVRLLATAVLAWSLGFAVFVVFLPGAAASTVVTDVIVVPTGGSGRIARGARLVADGKAKRMLITGVPPMVKASEIAAENKLDPRVFACCVDLGHEASNTRSNAEETTGWLRARKVRSLRLVTTDWHMPRARLELDQVVAQDIVIVNDGIASRAAFDVLMREYNKYLLRRAAIWAGL
jgi:uncharacterized SAM-binding protein YcdF (DUF218 family)